MQITPKAEENLKADNYCGIDNGKNIPKLNSITHFYFPYSVFYKNSGVLLLPKTFSIVDGIKVLARAT